MSAGAHAPDLVSATFGNANVKHFYHDWYDPKNSYHESPPGLRFGCESDEHKFRNGREL